MHMSVKQKLPSLQRVDALLGRLLFLLCPALGPMYVYALCRLKPRKRISIISVPK